MKFTFPGMDYLFREWNIFSGDKKPGMKISFPLEKLNELEKLHELDILSAVKRDGLKETKRV